MQEKRLPRSISGRRFAVRLRLQPSVFLSFLICILHGLLFLALLLTSRLSPFVYMAILFLMMISVGLWLLRHWSMSAFVLCLRDEQARSQGACSGLLQGPGDDLLNPPEARLEWQHFELMIWRVEVSSELVAKQLESSVGSAEANYWQLICRHLWAVLPTHHFRWRLLLLRRDHDAEAWRLLCQRVRLLA